MSEAILVVNGVVKNVISISSDGFIPKGYEPSPGKIGIGFELQGDGSFLRPQSTPVERSDDEIDAIRRIRYSRKVDPLLMEAKIKRLQGDNLAADALEQQALDARSDIQQNYPKKM